MVKMFLNSTETTAKKKRTGDLAELDANCDAI